MDIKGVLWHSTGANNPNLRRYVQPSDNAPDRQKMLDILGINKSNNDWNHEYREAGLNCWIGKLADGSVTTVQTMPWNYRPWGCGSGKKGSCNTGWIQFEICESDLNDKDYFEKAYKEACEITAYLCSIYNINPLGTVNYNGVVVPTILCHQDSYQLGLGSNHGDIYHWFTRYGKDMSTVRNDVLAIMNNIEEDEDMTQEKFNEHMAAWMKEQNKKAPSGYQQDALVWGQSNGLMVGDETGNLMAQRFLTRGEFITVLKRFFDKFMKK